jgi:glycosyltransferase involved in cell wall biosynthesis
MMSVLHVYTGNLYGGVETMLATLARFRDSVPELETRFALAWDGRLAAELREAGAPVAILGGARLSRPWTVWRARSRFRRLLRDDRPEVAIFHSAWSHGIFAPVARRAGVRTVFWLHDAIGGGVAEARARRVAPDLAVCTSKYAAGTLPALFPGVHAEVIHPAVAPPPELAAERAAVRAELETADDAVVIVQASRMEPWKGHRTHLEALARIGDRPRWTCWMAGGARRPHEQRHLDEMRSLAERLGIARQVRWLGERGDVPRLLAAADLLCQPNLGAEPFGITCVEAMYAGIPVVTAAMGGPLETVSPDVGILVPPGDSGSFAGALRTLMADPELRARLGAAGPARAQALCDPATQLRRLHDLLAGAA